MKELLDPPAGRKPARVQIHTARLGARDPDVLDITRGSAIQAQRRRKPTMPGEFLAPSARLVFPTLAALKNARSEAEATAIWQRYAGAYLYEIRDAREKRRAEWDAVLARPRVVLVCFCTNPGRCHRTLAAEELAREGGEYLGELRPLDLARRITPPPATVRP